MSDLHHPYNMPGVSTWQMREAHSPFPEGEAGNGNGDPMERSFDSARGPPGTQLPHAQAESSQLNRAPSNPARLNAIAQLKRAASNRQMRGATPQPATSPSNNELPGVSPSPHPPSEQPDFAVQIHPTSPNQALLNVQDPAESESSHGHRRLDRSPIRIVQPSPSPSALDSGAVSPAHPLALSRSASTSRAEGNRSPLPSLEQLRSRILHERLTAGLQRSASASAASAAARAYAMDKLLGQDTSRNRATSPVSDSGGRISEEDEEDLEDGEPGSSDRQIGGPSTVTHTSPGRGAPPAHYDSEDEDFETSKRKSRRRGMGNQYLRPPSFRNSAAGKHLLRRSRTISGMSQRAEEERKAAFAQELEVGSPDGAKKKRMSRLPPRRVPSGPGRPDEGSPPVLPPQPAFTAQSPLGGEQNGAQMPGDSYQTDARAASPLQPPDDGSQDSVFGRGEPQGELSRKPSRRELARTEMMRKLSGRRLGGRSPVPPPRAPSPYDTTQQQEQGDASSRQSHDDAPVLPGSEDDSHVAQTQLAHGGAEDLDVPNAAEEDFDEDEAEELLASPTAPFRIPIQTLQPQDAHTGMPSPQFQSLPPMADPSIMDNLQLTPEQQIAFFQMQQLLQQQQAQLFASQAQMSQGVDAPDVSPRTSQLPATPVMTSNADATFDQLLTPAGSVSGMGKGTTWDSPGGQSLLNNNLIPSMHLAPFVSDSGQQQGLTSDVYAQNMRPNFAKGQSADVQDWPTSPTASSLGLADALSRSRLNSMDRYSLERREEAAEGQQREPDDHAEPGDQDSKAEPADSEPPSTASTDVDLSAYLAEGPGASSPQKDSAGGAARYDFLRPPKLVAAFESPDRPGTTYSQATSMGDGDHFMYESMLAGAGASASTLGHFPNIPSPKFGQVSAASPRMIPGSSLAGAMQNQSPVPPLISPRGGSLARDQAAAAIAAARARAAGSPTAARAGQHTLQPPAEDQGSPMPSPAEELDDMERFAAWKKWMKAQGMDVEGDGDEESPARGPPLPASVSGDGSIRTSSVSTSAQSAGVPAPLSIPSLNSGTGSLSARPGSDRIEDDFSISPTLLKEFGSDIEWPGRPNLRGPNDAPGARGAGDRAYGDNSTHAEGNRRLEAPNRAGPALGLDAPSVPPKPRLQPQRSASTRRKAPPTINAAEAKALEEMPNSRSPRSDRGADVSPAAGPSSVAESDRHALSPQSHRARLDEASNASHRDAADAHDAQPGSEMGMTRSPPMNQPQSDLGHFHRSDSIDQASPHLGSSHSEQHHGGNSSQMSGRSFSETRQQAGGNGMPDASTQKTPPSAWSGTNATPRYGYRSHHHRVPSASEFETENAYANGKLTPFPGLLRNQPSNLSNTTGRSQSPAIKFAPSPATTDARSPPSVSSPLLDTSSPAGKEATAQQEGSAPKSVGLFGSLRRKASAVVRKGSMRRKVGESPEGKTQASPSSSPRVGDRQLPYGQSDQEALPRAQEIEQPASSQGQRTPVTPVSASRQTPRVQTFDRYANAGAALARKPSRVAATGDEGKAGQTQEKSAEAQQPAPHIVAAQPKLRGLAAQNAHSRNVSEVSAASSQQPQHASSSPSRPSAKQILPVGEDSLDAGFAAPASRETAPIATAQLEPKTAAMLHRYSRVLTTTTKANANSPGVPPGLTSMDLDSPPRQLLKVSPVFQVVSSSMIKDRFLILFNDILVIAKPVAPPPSQALARHERGSDEVAEVSLPDIRWTFLVKNIIELRHLSLTVPKDHRSKVKPHPLQGIFIEAFSHDADGAVSDIIKRTGLPNTASTVAQLLIQTPELDRDALTAYICAPERREVLAAFVKLQRVVGVSIESALRTILIGLRFPSDSVAFEVLLMTLSAHWVEENRHLIKSNFTSQLAADLTFAIMALNDALHGKGGAPDEDDDDFSEMSVRGSVASVSLNSYHPPGIFSEPMRTLSSTAFVSAFRAHDPDMVLSDRTLLRIYASVKAEPIQQALGRGEVAHKKPVWIVGSGLPLKLTYGVPSEPVLVSIPTPDPDFTIRLYGHDLSFDPPILSFASANTRSFTITSRSLGARQAVFVRSGRAARCYSGSVMGKDVSPAMQAAAARGSIADLPSSVSLSVERAFMQHSFTLNASISSSAPGQGPAGAEGAQRRKFMFSVDNSDLRRKWATTLQSAIDESLQRRAETQAEISGKQGNDVAERAKARRAANALALHVLRQALISPDVPAKASTADSGHKAPSMLQRSVSAAAGGASGQPGTAGNRELSGSASTAARNVGQLHSRTPSDSELAFGSDKAGAKAGQDRGLGPNFAGRRGPSTLAVGTAQASLARNASVSQHYYAPRSGAGREERELLPSPPLPGSASFKPSGADAAAAPSQSQADVASAAQGGADSSKRHQPPQSGSGRIDARQGGASVDQANGDRILSGEELVTICTQNSLLPIVLERGGGNPATGPLA